MYIIVAHEKDDIALYKDASTLLAARIKDGFWYSDVDTVAAQAAFDGGEQKAWRFLLSRSDAEYEHVEFRVVK